MRAREREQAAAALEQPHRAQVDLLVAARRRVERRPAARKRRRVEDDDAEARPAALEPSQLVEGVLRADLRLGLEPVQREVLASARDRLGRRFDADGSPGAAAKRVAGEAGGVAEGVQDVAALG